MPIFGNFEFLPLCFYPELFFINEQRKTLSDEKTFSFTDPSCEINFALYGFSNCWRHLPPNKRRHVPSIIHTWLRYVSQEAVLRTRRAYMSYTWHT